MINEMTECFMWNQFTIQWHKFSAYDFYWRARTQWQLLLLLLLQRHKPPLLNTNTHKWSLVCMLRFGLLFSIFPSFFRSVSFNGSCKTCDAFLLLTSAPFYSIWIAFAWQTNIKLNDHNYEDDHTIYTIHFINVFTPAAELNAFIVLRVTTSQCLSHYCLEYEHTTQNKWAHTQPNESQHKHYFIEKHADCCVRISS